MSAPIAPLDIIPPPALLAYAALGAFAHWMLLRYGRNAESSFSQFVDDIVDGPRIRLLVQVLVFVSVGAMISVIMTGPTTSRQALAAGMAWTTLLGSLATAGTKPRSSGASR